MKGFFLIWGWHEQSGLFWRQLHNHSHLAAHFVKTKLFLGLGTISFSVLLTFVLSVSVVNLHRIVKLFIKELVGQETHISRVDMCGIGWYWICVGWCCKIFSESCHQWVAWTFGQCPMDILLGELRVRGLLWQTWVIKEYLQIVNR